MENHKHELVGDVTIDSKGIAVCNGDCSILTYEDSAFSFNIIQIKTEKNPKIEFGLKTQSDNTLKFDFASVVGQYRQKSIYPQISIDGINVIIHMLIENSNLVIFIDNTEVSKHELHEIGNYNFFLNISNSQKTILITSLNTDPLPAIFFLNLQSTLWNSKFHLGNVNNFITYNSQCPVRPTSAIALNPLNPIPGSNGIIYFEFTKRFGSNQEGYLYKIGLSTSSDTSKSPSSMYYQSVNNSIVLGEKVIKISKKPKTFGFGNDPQKGPFYTLDGEIFYFGVGYNKTNFYPFYRTKHSIQQEFYLNYGQVPFAYKGIPTTKGWNLFTFQHIPPIKYGIYPHRHVLNFYTSAGAYVDYCLPIMFDKIMKEGSYEVHLISMYKENSENLYGIGFGDDNYRRNNMIGWDSNCLGLHSDDGKSFYDNDDKQTVDPSLFIPGLTEAVNISKNKVTYYIDKEQYKISKEYPYEGYPTITVRGPISLIINMGETPFYYQNEDQENGIQLFNKLKVEMTNMRLDKFELEIGDMLESRDRSFRGTFVGELNDRLYCTIPGLKGAYPLVETEPYDFMLNYRVIRRNNSKPLFQSFLIVDSFLTVDISKSDFPMVYATQSGLSTMIGTCEKGYVFRPVQDLYNNKSLCVYKELPPKVPNYNPSFEFLDEEYFLFDIVLTNGNDVVMLLGKNEQDEIVSWNGNEYITFQEKPKKIIWRTFGIAFIRKRLMEKNLYSNGMNIGGVSYPRNVFANSNDVFLYKEDNRVARGLNPTPELFEYFTSSLCEKLLADENKEKEVKNESKQDVNLSFDWVYSVADAEYKPQNINENKLTKEVKW
ncbi:ran-binding protein 9 isoform X2 [Histomonas meleagridis]|uniref:ran-binding protein 9 isoform X2 n=1 Tax=Histomonas meleagridis TaxID=135588 RepID=UPI003559F65E|nr:ran-binding protein 9 isoform X2 [Histomonas meleagridis]KAH0802448.1 ran-binding protein 9 isoform X2 [Histomonas meleagridis]